MFQALVEGWWNRIPGQCAVCHRWPAQPVCEECVSLFGQPVHRCRTCAIALDAPRDQCGQCLLHPPPLDATYAAVAYAYPWSELISNFKFREATGWARWFASLMRNLPWLEPALDTADWVLPMPLSAERLQHRGFNQSALLARALAGPKCRTDVLLRVRDTPAQSGLARPERIQNVRHAFAIDPVLRPLLEGQRVLLVDDVMTTGASLFACAEQIRLAGASHIAAVVLARTE